MQRAANAIDENPHLAPARVRAALRALDVRPTREMGQNFLVDATALAAIVAAGAPDHDETIIEVGPGLGVLTWELLRRSRRVIAVELDRRLVGWLRQAFDGAPLTVIEADVLRLTPTAMLEAAQLSPTQAYRVIANLPYAITSPVLRHFLEAAHPPQALSVLVQREVAERITAAPGDLSVLAHAIQIHAAPRVAAIIPREAFVPVPAVESAVLVLQRRTVPLVPAAEQPRVMRVIKAGFLHARKQLGNSLPAGLTAMGLPLPRPALLAILDAAQIDAMRRAETLTIDEWRRIADALAPLMPGAARRSADEPHDDGVGLDGTTPAGAAADSGTTAG